MAVSGENDETEYNALDDISIPPEKILEGLVHQLKHPLYSIEGWAKVLQLEELAEEHPTALKMIPLNIQMMHNILDETLKYVEKRKALKAEKGDTETNA